MKITIAEIIDKCEDMKNIIYDLAEKVSIMAEDAIRGK